jgi:hypothetical protein
MNVMTSTLLPIDPFLYVTPPEQDEEDPTFLHPVRITVYPFGKSMMDTANVSITMEIDEAIAIAQTILQGVEQAREMFGDE